jgi:Mrp family chromosome partitioning ATPase
MNISYRQDALPSRTRRGTDARNTQLSYPMLEIAARIFRKPPQRHVRHIMVTGAMRRVGTSFITRGLAETLSLGATRVLIVEILPELGQPNELPRLLEAPPTLSAEQPTMLRLGSAEFMALIAPGSPQFAEISSRLGERFDIVIWDMPPPGMATPTAVAAELMDGVMLVIEAGRTSRRALVYAAERLRGSNATTLGVVMNRAASRQPGWFGRTP